MDENVGKPSSVSKGIIVVVLVVIVVLAAGVYEFNKSSTSSSSNASLSTSQNTTTSSNSQNSSYKDGKYTAEGDYISPGGKEMIDVSLTLQSGKIADVTVVSKATRPTSKEYQGVFIENYKPLVMGKNIDDVKLEEVSGSSLTPEGFNDAISKIKSQAKS